MVEVISTAKFSNIIETVVMEKRISYMDAVCWWCEKHEMEIEVAAKLLNTVIKAKLEVEAQDLNYLAKSARLPI
jgi:hypothetical protein|tara:strand:+ start:1581 stop:1802 length:222 start_codon:yes stop_codon:yes gene_type:complete